MRPNQRTGSEKKNIDLKMRLISCQLSIYQNSKDYGIFFFEP